MILDNRVPQMLTAHFSLQEMCASGTAVRLGIRNVPDSEARDRLRLLCEHVLEPLRKNFGVIRVTSGYRCERLNAIVGGSARSQHVRGEAADIHISSIEVGRKMFQFIKQHLDFDQLLFEHVRGNGACWLHVSYRAGELTKYGLLRLNRRQAVDNYVTPPTACKMAYVY